MSTSCAQIMVFKYCEKPKLLGVMNDSISNVKNIQDDFRVSSCNKKQENKDKWILSEGHRNKQRKSLGQI